MRHAISRINSEIFVTSYGITGPKKWYIDSINQLEKAKATIMEYESTKKALVSAKCY